MGDRLVLLRIQKSRNRQGEILRISVQRAVPQDERIREQWNALVQQMERPEVFYTCEWATAVGQAYRDSIKPLLLLAYDGDALVGAAALATDNAEKQVSFLCGNTADYCDFICRPAQRGEFLEAAFEELSKLHLPILRLANLPADSATSAIMKVATGRHGYLIFSRPAYQCAQI